MSSFRVVFLDGTSGPIEGAVVRFTGDDGLVEDISIPYLMTTLATVEDAKDAMEITVQYPAASTDPKYTAALYAFDVAIATLLTGGGGVTLPPVVQQEPNDIEVNSMTSTTAPPEPEFWN